MLTIQWKRALLLAGKIAIGSSLAIITAELLHLQFAASAGTVTLLTVLTTRKGTLKLSGARIVTFLLAAVITLVTLLPIHSEWLAFGLYIFLVSLISERFGLRATISTNAVIGTHFLTTLDFSPAFFLNEFLLVFIGIVYAFLLSLWQNEESERESFRQHIHQLEQDVQGILGEIAKYLSNEPCSSNLWQDLTAIQGKLEKNMAEAYEYEGNTKDEDAGYYARYFEMRMNQVTILVGLQREMQKIKSMPVQAERIAEYIRYLNQYILELNEPTQQMQRLDEMFQQMKTQPLPVTREEFENRAVLYHILMDLEEFLLLKKRFVDSGDSTHLMAAEAGEQDP